MDIVTGHVGSAHVTSWQDRDLNQGIFGSGTYILGVGSKLAATIISNNEIDIADGVLVMQGCQGVIQKGTYQAMTIDNGSAGMKRYDLICAEYTKVGGVEDLDLVVVKGTPSSSTPSDPSVTSGDIQNGDSPVQVPIYRVSLNGLTVESVTALVDTQDSVSGIISAIDTIGTTYSDVNSLGTAVATGNTPVTIASVNVPAGTYVVSGTLFFNSSATGNFEMSIAGGTFGDHIPTFPATEHGGGVAVSGACVCQHNFSFTIDIRARQWASSSVTTNGSIVAVRIK